MSSSDEWISKPRTGDETLDVFEGFAGDFGSPSRMDQLRYEA